MVASSGPGSIQREGFTEIARSIPIQRDGLYTCQVPISVLLCAVRVRWHRKLPPVPVRYQWQGRPHRPRLGTIPSPRVVY